MGLIFAGIAAYLTSQALEYGTLILNSFTPCFTIICTVILSRIILNESFTWTVDGASVLIIISGCVLGLLQQPFEKVSEFTANNIADLAIIKLTQFSSIVYYAFALTIFTVRYILLKRLGAKLDQFEKKLHNGFN